MGGSGAVLARRAEHAPARMLAAMTGALIALAALALIYVVYALWPRWPEAPAEPNAPALPIIVGEVLFRIPPAAIRQKVQRHAGTQERIDLAFLWPTLEPSAPTRNAANAGSAAPRLFINVVAAPTAMTPAERLKQIYPRYVERNLWVGPQGLTAVAFRADTPYRGEELFYDAAAPDRFIVRCTRKVGPTQGSCLYERFLGAASITVRFSRDWLDDWRKVLAGIDEIIDGLQPAAH
jgi:hypothetical protein